MSLLAAAVAPWKSSAAAQEMCDEECTKELDKKEVVTTPSGLQYRVIEEGSGAKMQPGYQAVTDWVAYNQEGKLFENSIAEGRPRDVRVTGASDSRNIIAGLDEGILSMRVGEKRRLYIPGYLAYQRGLKAAPGRPAIPPKSPLVIDVHLRSAPPLPLPCPSLWRE